MRGLFGIAPFLIILVAACGSSVRIPGPGNGGTPNVPDNYPMTVVESAEHRNAVSKEWSSLFEAYGVPPDRRKTPELAPFTHTPQSILGAGPIKLATPADTTTPDEQRVRLLLRDFVAKHADLLGVSAGTLSLDSVTDAGQIGKRYSFVQEGFSYPIEPPAGRLEFIVTPAAEIIQISDTAIPFADLPRTPNVTRETAAQKVVGMAFTYNDIAGRERSVTMSDPAAVHATRLVVYPAVTEAALSVRLAWEVEAGAGMTWTVFVDAITGQVVGQRQNFQT
jgi:hypothetical protein